MDGSPSCRSTADREPPARDAARAVAALRASVLFVTHDLREALALADRICFLSPSPGGWCSSWRSISAAPARSVGAARRLHAYSPAIPSRRRPRRLWRRERRPMTEAREVLLQVRGVRKGLRCAAGAERWTWRCARASSSRAPGPTAPANTLFQLLTGDCSTPTPASCGCAARTCAATPVRALGRIGVVFQQMTLDLDLSVEANLVFHARLHRHRAASRARIADAASRRRRAAPTACASSPAATGARSSSRVRPLHRRRCC